MTTRIATCICHVRRAQKELRPTELDIGCSRFVLSSGSVDYGMAEDIRLSPDENQFPCRTPGSCLFQTNTKAGLQALNPRPLTIFKCTAVCLLCGPDVFLSVLGKVGIPQNWNPRLY